MQSQSTKKVAAMFERLDKLGINNASGGDLILNKILHLIIQSGLKLC